MVIETAEIVDSGTAPAEQAIVRQAETKPETAMTLTPAQMLSLAVQQNADTAKLKELMDMQERYERNQARKAYIQAIASFRAQCPTIARTGKVNMGAGKPAYSYAKLADTVEQIEKLLAECQLAVTWVTVDQTPTWIKVRCTVAHVMGHTESCELGGGPDASGSKNSIQAIKSTWSYLRRVTLFSLLGLVDKDEVDDDGAGGSQRTETKPAASITGTDSDKVRFANVCSVKSKVKLAKHDFLRLLNETSEFAKLTTIAECSDWLEQFGDIKDGHICNKDDGEGCHD